jgi:hypothetical protein
LFEPQTPGWASGSLSLSLSIPVSAPLVELSGARTAILRALLFLQRNNTRLQQIKERPLMIPNNKNYNNESTKSGKDLSDSNCRAAGVPSMYARCIHMHYDELPPRRKIRAVPVSGPTTAL